MGIEKCVIVWLLSTTKYKIYRLLIFKMLCVGVDQRIDSLFYPVGLGDWIQVIWLVAGTSTHLVILLTCSLFSLLFSPTQNICLVSVLVCGYLLQILPLGFSNLFLHTVLSFLEYHECSYSCSAFCCLSYCHVCGGGCVGGCGCGG